MTDEGSSDQVDENSRGRERGIADENRQQNNLRHKAAVLRLFLKYCLLLYILLS